MSPVQLDPDPSTEAVFYFNCISIASFKLCLQFDDQRHKTL